MAVYTVDCLKYQWLEDAADVDPVDAAEQKQVVAGKHGDGGGGVTVSESVVTSAVAAASAATVLAVTEEATELRRALEQEGQLRLELQQQVSLTDGNPEVRVVQIYEFTNPVDCAGRRRTSRPNGAGRTARVSHARAARATCHASDAH